MPFEDKVSLKGTSNMIYHTFLGNTSQQNPIYLGYCCWQLILNKDTKHTEKGEMTKQKSICTCYRIFCNSFID